jgi:hypothetical protein
LIIRGNGKMDDYVYEFELDANLIPTPAADSAPWISFRNDIKNVIIEQGVKNIGDNAFCDCCNLTSIVIPPSVTSIGDSAFYDCNNLISVVIPPSVTGIDDNAFSRCCSLTSVVIPDSVTRIGEFAFSGCYHLTSVVIPASVTGIGYGVFYECSGLEIISVAEDNPEYTSVDNVLFSKDMTRLIVCSEQKCGDYVIPASVTRIADSAFSGCRRLRFISIPASVTSIGSEVFCECEDLEIICVAEDSPAYISVDSVLFNKDMTRLIAYPESKRGNYVIPASVTCIDDCAFLRCIYLTSVIIPESVWYIGDYAFACCIDLTSVVIPASVTDIGDGAFLNCDSMYWVTCMNTKPPKINSDVFGYCDMFDCLRTLRVPGSAIRAYRRAKGWKTFENIHPIQ